MGVGLFAGLTMYLGVEGINIIAKKEILSSMGMVLFTLFIFLSTSFGIELSKDIEATEQEGTSK